MRIKSVKAVYHTSYDTAFIYICWINTIIKVMKTDLYTKVILTIIALALVANLFKDIDFVSKAKASPGSPAEAQIAPTPANSSLGNVVDINIVSVNGRSIYGNELPIKIKDEVAVKIKNSGSFDKIPIEVR